MAGGNFFDAGDDPVVDQMQEKRGADIRQSNASAGAAGAGAEKSRADATTENITRPYKVRKAAADAIAAERDANKPKLTPGQQKADEAYAGDEYVKWRAMGGFANVEKQLGQFKRILGDLKTRDDLSGPWISTLPDWMQKFITPDALDTRDQVERLTQSAIKQVLDSQFAAREAERVLAREFNPALEEKTNLVRLEDQLGLALRTAAAREAAARHFDETGSLVGFKPEMAKPILEDYTKRVGAGAPEDTVVDGNETTASTPQGQPIKAKRLSQDAAFAIQSYMRSPEFSPEGYARMVTAKQIEEGLASPEQAGAAFQDNLKAAQEYFSKTPPDKAGPGFDYTESDRRAREQAGVGETLLQAGKNLPESAANLVQGALSLPVDAISSVVQGQRVGSVKGITDLGMELGDVATGGKSGPAMHAFGDMVSERYGSGQALKNTAATDPLGLAGDLSLALTGGGSAAARLPGVLGRVGEATATAGRVIDPLSAIVAGAETAGRAIPDAVKAAPGNLAAGTLGLSTGAGGAGIKRAAAVGYDAGRTGKPDRATNFLEQLRGANPEEVVSQASEAVRRMQEEASTAYKSGMIDTKNDATILSFDGIDNALRGLRERAFYKGAVKDPRAAATLEKVTAIVDDWRARDPAEFHTPEGMDALKQRVGDVAEEFATGNDRRAASIATGVYKQVRKAVADQVPSYAAAMKQYEKAADALRNIRKTFSINPNASVDTQLRKLQSTMRNNVNTSYGYRQKLTDLMERHGGPEMVDSIAAQSLNAWAPRGLNRALAGGAAASGVTGGAMSMIPGMSAATGAVLNPANLLALPVMSPRAMGEAAYYAGKGTGMAARVANPALTALAKAYNAHPTAALALTQAGSRGNDIEELSGRYDLDNVVMGYGGR